VNAVGEWSFTPTTALADGLHQVRARATDSVGNIGVFSSTHEFTVDATAPLAAAILTPANGGVVGPAFSTFTGTAEPGTTVTVVLDGLSRGSAPVDVAGRWSFRLAVALLAGTHVVKAQAMDTAGNAGPFSADTEFTLDDSPPGVPVLVSPADGALLNSPKPPITGMAEVGSTVTVFMDGVPVGDVLVGATGSWSFTLPMTLGDARHEVKARATDASANVGLFSLVHTFTVDTIAPHAPVIATPVPGSLLKTATPLVSGSAEAGSIVTVFFDGAVAGTALADGAGGWSFIPAAPLADGTHGVSARARDGAGNTGVSTSTLSFTVDATAPVAPVVHTPAAGAVVGPAMPSFTGLAEANSTVIVFLGGVDVGKTRADGSGSWSFTAPLTLGNGAQRMWATATDAAGNTGPASTQLNFTVDAIAPAPPTLVAPADGTLLNRARPSFSGKAESDSKVTVFIDAVPVGMATADVTGAWALTSPVALADGPHQVKAQATDTVGNVGTFSVTHTFTVDTVAPGVPVVLSPAQGAVLSTGTPDITGTAEPGSTVSILMGNIEVGTAPVGSSGGWIFIPTAPFPEGASSVQARATDAAGNVGGASAARSFTVDLSPPGTPELVTPKAGELLSTSTPVFTGTAEPGSTVTLFLDGVSFGRVQADAAGAWSWTASLRVADGAHSVKVQATDAAGSAGLFSGAVSFSVDTVVPDTFLSGGPSGQTEQKEATFELSASEPGVSYLCRLDSADFAPCTSPVTFSELIEGSHTFEVRARDAAGHEDPTPARHGWTVTHREVVEGGGVGCSTPGTAASLAPWGLLGLAWLLSRRRRS
jgi:MYXO-CTERM domain-containing protein